MVSKLIYYGHSFVDIRKHYSLSQLILFMISTNELQKGRDFSRMSDFRFAMYAQDEDYKELLDKIK